MIGRGGCGTVPFTLPLVPDCLYVRKEMQLRGKGVRSWGGPIELFLVPASAPRLYVLSCLWDGAYKRTIAANRKE